MLQSRLIKLVSCFIFEFEKFETYNDFVTFFLRRLKLQCLLAENGLWFSCSLYRIVVERLSSKKVIVKRQASSSSPCHMSHVQLRRGYFAARNNGDNCYIAAELPSVERGEMFIVGDNKTYGGFYNAPLQCTETYRVWFGIFVTVDGVSCNFSE